MDKLKNNPSKYIKITVLVYLVLNIVFYALYRYLYYRTIALTSEIPIKIGILPILEYLIRYISIILFTVYIFKFYHKNKNHLLLTLSYSVSALLALVSLISNISQLKYMFYWETFEQWLYYGCIEQIIHTIFGAIILAITIFNIVNCITKFKFLRASQTLVFIQAILAVVSILISIIIYIATGKTVVFITIIGWIVSLTNLISMFAYVIFWKYGVSATSTTPTENALYTIKKQLDEGVIGMDEYHSKKAEILNNL